MNEPQPNNVKIRIDTIPCELCVCFCSECGAMVDSMKRIGRAHSPVFRPESASQ